MSFSNKQEGHWLGCLGVPRLGVAASRVVFSEEIDAALWEICDLGGLGDLEKMLAFNAEDSSPPAIEGRDAEIYALRDRLKSEQRLVLEKALELCGTTVKPKGIQFDYHYDLHSTLKALFKKGSRRR